MNVDRIDDDDEKSQLESVQDNKTTNITKRSLSLSRSSGDENAEINWCKMIGLQVNLERSIRGGVCIGIKV